MIKQFRTDMLLSNITCNMSHAISNISENTIFSLQNQGNSNITHVACHFKYF